MVNILLIFCLSLVSITFSLHLNSPIAITVTECDSKCSCNGYFLNKTSGACSVCRNGTTSTASTGFQCGLCPANYQCNLGIQKQCNIGAGYFSPPGSSSCNKCPVGYSRTQNALTGSYQCTACQEGQWSFDGLTCQSCLAGFACIGQGHYVTCVAGSYSSAGSFECSPCGRGFYNQIPASSSCQSCKPGTYSFYPFQECYDCPDGYACPNTAGSQGQITKCLPGTFSDIGASVCTPCPAGYYSNFSGASSCSLCGYNTFSRSGASNCTACSGKSTSLPGASVCTGGNIIITQKDSSSSSNNVGATVGIAVAIVIIVLCCIICAYRFSTRNKKTADIQFNQWTGGEELLEESI